MHHAFVLCSYLPTLCVARNSYPSLKSNESDESKPRDRTLLEFFFGLITEVSALLPWSLKKPSCSPENAALLEDLTVNNYG